MTALFETVTGYPGLFALCAGSGIVVPFPEDVALIYAGVRVGTGEWAWGPTLCVALAGVLTRDVVAWSFGRTVGGWLLGTALGRRLVGERRVARAQRLVATHGSVAVLVGRFLVGFRAPVFMVAGAMGVPLRAFTAWDLLGLCVAVPVVVGLGFAFGEPINGLVFWLMQRTRVVIACVVVGAIVWGLWRLWHPETRPDLDHLGS